MSNDLSLSENTPVSMVPFTYAENPIPLSWHKDDVRLLINGPDLIITTASGKQLTLTMGAKLASLHTGLFKLTFSDGKTLDSEEIMALANIQDVSPERDKASESRSPTAHPDGKVVVKQVVVEEIITVNSKGGGETEQADDSTYAELEVPVQAALVKLKPIDDSIVLVKKSAGSPAVEHTQVSDIPTPITPTPPSPVEPTIVFPKVTLLQIGGWRDDTTHVYQVGSGSDSARSDGSILHQYQPTLADLSQENANWTIDARNSERFAEGTVARIIRFDEAVGQVSLTGLPASYQAIVGGSESGNQYGLLPGEVLLIYPQSQYHSFTVTVAFTDASGEAKRQNMAFNVVDNPTSLINSDGHIQLAATPNNVSVIGGFGDDLILAGKGNDSYNGGAGSNRVDFSKSTAGLTIDLLNGTATGGGQYGLTNVQHIIGTEFADVLIGNGQDNHLQGGAGDDTLHHSGGNNIFDGGAGLNTLSYQTASAGVSVNMSQNQASNNGHGGADHISNIQQAIGSQFNDLIVGDSNNNALYGEAGDDVLSGMGGDNILDGGGGVNTASYVNSTSAIQADLTTNRVSNGFGAMDTLINIQGIIGSGFDDRIVSANGSSSINAGAGNDVLMVGGNARSRAILDGGAGDDRFIAGYGYNAFIGGGGTDTVDYGSALSGTSISMKDSRAYINGFGGIDQFNRITGIVGSGFDDRIELGGEGAIIHAGGGNDLIISGAGSNNVVDGGSGINTLDYGNASVGIDVSLQQGMALQNGFGGHDVLSNIQDLIGSAWNDSIEGDDDNNNISARAADDRVYGSKGDDVIDGGAGSNTLDYGRLTDGVTVNMATGQALKRAGGTDSFMLFDRFVGTALDDSFSVAAGVSSVDGGGGFDSIDFGTMLGSLTVNLDAGTAVGRNGTNHGMGTVQLSGIEKVVISAGPGSHFVGHLTDNNQFVGGAGNDVFRPNGGNNVITGGGGADWVEYIGALHGVNVNLNHNGVGPGFSSDNGFGGEDMLNGISHLRGSSYDDVLSGSGNLEGGDGNDRLNGNNNTSAYAYYASVNTNKGVTVDLRAGITTEDGYGLHDQLIGINNVVGTNYKDRVYGNNDNNIVRLGAGDDYLYASRGNDTLYGESGTDIIDYGPLNALVNVDLSSNRASKGANGTDLLSSFENVTGTQYADVLKGSSDSNVLNGGGGDDVVIGLGGNDTLIGGDGFVTADYSLSPAGIVAKLSTGQVHDGYGSLDTLIFISKITGSAKDDIFEIANSLDLHQYTLDGGAGNDAIKKSGGGGLFTLGDGSFHISNIERLDFADGRNDTLNLDLSGLFHGSSPNASIGLSTDAGDTVNIHYGSGWSMTFSDSSHETWSHGGQNFSWSWI
ncbi:beta strand repeat-containing protein [Budvicia diplopodorum]|uniref:beta strand repeat-containing protein n=1 Tax=Budvicia diplopodorum TaxID=1119056 RepID=UPI0013599E98|nr:calcium-binding protein [Budvicia diplopodorum]